MGGLFTEKSHVATPERQNLLCMKSLTKQCNIYHSLMLGYGVPVELPLKLILDQFVFSWLRLTLHSAVTRPLIVGKGHYCWHWDQGPCRSSLKPFSKLRSVVSRLHITHTRLSGTFKFKFKIDVLFETSQTYIVVDSYWFPVPPAGN